MVIDTHAHLDHCEDEIRIVDIALLPKYRNTGVGTQILSSILAQAKNREVPVLISAIFSEEALTRSSWPLA